MSIDKAEIQNIAWLARLAIDDASNRRYKKDLSDILALVEQMRNIDTTGIEPLAHPLEMNTRLRMDEITETNQRDHFQEMAPEVVDGYYIVPRVIE